MQSVKVVDVTKSFIVVDPNSFVQNLAYTGQEDAPEKEPPILAYEGYNFLPTAYGYRSFFGQNSALGVDLLTSRCDKILMYQFATYQNILIALCEDGIKIVRPSANGNDWIGGAELSWANQDWLGGRGMIQPDDATASVTTNTYRQWTYAVLENTIYIYRQGDTFVSKIGPLDIDIGTGDVTIHQLTPTFLNMAGQIGIFRANGRLGFWDSANSVAWSSLFNLMDFTPSLETLAGNAIFTAILGRIVTILTKGDGFVLYTTKGIVNVRYSATSATIWEADTLSDTAGIAFPHEVTTGLTELEHYAYTNTGIKRIGNYNVVNKSSEFQEILTDVYDLLKEDRQPVYLDMINGRFLCLSLINNSYIDGYTSFTLTDVDSITIRVLVNDGPWDGISPIPTVNGFNNIVDGVPISESIASQIAGGWKLGMYLQWKASGTCFYPAQLNTAIYPYNLDSWSVHIPNTGIDLTETLEYYGDAKDVTAGRFNAVIPDVNPIPADIDLGWTYPGLGNISSFFKGRIDSYLDEFIRTQEEERKNFATIQAANVVAIEAIPDKVDTFNEVFIGFTVQECADYIAAQTDIGFTDEHMRDYPGGGGVITTSATGVHTNYAHFEWKIDLKGGYSIWKRTAVRYDIVDMNESINIYRVITSINPVGTPGSDLTFYGLTNAAPWDAYMAHDFTGSCTNGVVRVDTSGTPVIAPSQGIGWYGVSGQTYFVSTGLPSGSADNDYFTANINTARLFTTTGHRYAVNRVVTYSIYQTTNNFDYTTHTMIANQRILTWGDYISGQPPQYGVDFSTATTGDMTIDGSLVRASTTRLITDNVPPYAQVTYPGNTFLIQDGAPSPVYPTFSGALVFDTALKKWGKLKASYQALLDISPINTASQSLDFTNFGIDMAMLGADGRIVVFDALPTDSYIRYGKVGYYRLGVTQLQEVKVYYRRPANGTIEIDTSLYGVTIDAQLTNTAAVVNSIATTLYGDTIGKWHTIKITGQFDLHYLEFRGNIAGRR